ncbi:uncharacterized protein B4U79_17505 [Dinothrombium tinctorium]|uniref:CUB domain-containing protein n=1 Tax=Dinothrombium tinctorium TaxID=1965070 RepID=A0A3S3P445_9ACAR|nr:uncharacterized protein B4U79_17505 [Dinothrombium tinctorium]
MSETECKSSSGLSAGGCESYASHAVCCIYVSSCGDLAKNNVTYFVNPNGPLGFSEPSTCTLRVNKIEKDICQFRLDFEDFRIVGPQVGDAPFRYHPATSRSPSILGALNRHSNCKDDVFTVYHGNRNHPIPIICGTNTGQHMYIPVDKTDHDSVAITFLTGINDFKRFWRIKISQFSCKDVDLLAPQGCLQYHTTPRGTITSFNYEGDHYLQNIDYSICIYRPKDMCFLSFQRNPPPVNATTNTNADVEAATFNGKNSSSLSKILSNANGTIVEARTIIHDTCRNAGYWITWPGTDRICSEDIETLNIPVTISTSAPQIIHFFSSPWDENRKETRGAYQGFSLNYTHLPCTHGYF